MQNFDFNEALKAIQSGKPITGSDGVLAPLIKQLTEAALSAEIDSYLEQNPSSNVSIRPTPIAFSKHEAGAHQYPYLYG